MLSTSRAHTHLPHVPVRNRHASSQTCLGIVKHDSQRAALYSLKWHAARSQRAKPRPPVEDEVAL